MIFNTFEIKIALLGHVSVGKTTVLNALLRDKYGEVSLRRTTAGINHFRIIGKSNGEGETKNDVNEVSDNESLKQEGGSLMDWSVTTENPRSADSTLKEITADNITLRDSSAVQEKFFDIELQEEICEMRKNTRLVFVDIPGINKAGSSSKYRDYVASKWDTFDCVIVVMDAKDGVSTEEKVNLLRFVKQNNENKKKIPVIILCNKVDGPDEAELEMLVGEVSAEVERIFNVGCQKKSLNFILNLSNNSPTKKRKVMGEDVYPAFIPISAIHAFIFQSASLLTLEQLKKFDGELIERIGAEEIGKRKWRKFTQDQKYKAVFEVISDPLQYQDGLKTSNFDKVLAVLDRFVGGGSTQSALIEKQIEVAWRHLSSGTCIATQICTIYQKSQALGKCTASFQKDFWDAYRICKDRVFKDFNLPENVDKLAEPLEQLIEFHRFAGQTHWSTVRTSVVEHMKALICQQLGVVFDQEKLWVQNDPPIQWWTDKSTTETICRELMSPLDWIQIYESILLLSFDKHFCEFFGKEKILMSLRVQAQYNQLYARKREPNDCPSCKTVLVKLDGQKYCNNYNNYHLTDLPTNCINYNCSTTRRLKGNPPYCSNCGRNYQIIAGDDFSGHLFVKLKNGTFEPENKKFKSILNVEVPKSLSDPKHFGHLAWKFCDFLATLERE